MTTVIIQAQFVYCLTIVSLRDKVKGNCHHYRNELHFKFKNKTILLSKACTAGVNVLKITSKNWAVRLSSVAVKHHHVGNILFPPWESSYALSLFGGLKMVPKGESKCCQLMAFHSNQRRPNSCLLYTSRCV